MEGEYSASGGLVCDVFLFLPSFLIDPCPFLPCTFDDDVYRIRGFFRPHSVRLLPVPWCLKRVVQFTQLSSLCQYSMVLTLVEVAYARSKERTN